MSSLPTRTATFASLKCRSKWDFLSKLRKDKKKGKRAVFPYENASFASIFYPFLPRLCCHNKYRLTKADSTIESPPSQSNCSKKHHLITKKADIFSLLSLHFFCALHFDLLFCKLDFFQSQQHVQSLTSNIFCYPAS